MTGGWGDEELGGTAGVASMRGQVVGVIRESGITGIAVMVVVGLERLDFVFLLIFLYWLHIDGSRQT